MRETRSSVSSIALLLSLLLLLGGCEEFDVGKGSQAAQAEGQKSGEQSGESTSESKAVDLPAGAASLERIPDVVETALPGVVGISTTRVMDRRRIPFFRGPGPFGRRFGRGGDKPAPRRQGMGSGVIVSKDGHVLTNNHVIEGADEIEVVMSDEDRFEAEIVGTDPKSDLAVLQLTSPPDDLKPLSFGNSDDLRLGQAVIAIGNPFGLSSTVTMGIISATGRGNVGIAEYEDFIQTDAAINPGNSGGALINLDGELVGINTAILSKTGAYQGVGFAIPANMAKSIMQSLTDDGEVRRGYLGVMIQTMNADLAESFGLPEETEGVLVSDIQDGGPADKAGLERDDIITHFAGKKTPDANSLKNAVAFSDPGTTQEMKVLRDGESMTIDVDLGELPSRSRPIPRRGDDPKTGSESALEGLMAAPLTPRVRAQFDIPASVRKGLVVVELQPTSKPARAGLRPGDVIVEANRKPVTSGSDLRRAMEAPGDRLLLLVWRDGRTHYVTVSKN